MLFLLGCGQDMVDVGAPVLPAEPVAVVFKAAGRDVVEEQDIGGIAFAVVAQRIAPVQLAVAKKVTRRDDGAGLERPLECQQNVAGAHARPGGNSGMQRK